MAVAEIDPIMTAEDYRRLTVACEKAAKELPEDSERRKRLETLAWKFSFIAEDLGAPPIDVKMAMAILAEFGRGFHWYTRREGGDAIKHNGVGTSTDLRDGPFFGGDEIVEFQNTWKDCIIRHVEDMVRECHPELEPGRIYPVIYRFTDDAF